MSTTDGGNNWQIELLNDFLPDLTFYSIDVLDNQKGWVTGLSDLLLVNEDIISNFQEIPSQDLLIFPNPVNTELNIQYEGKVNTLTLYDRVGKVVFTNQTLNQKYIHINTAQLLPGIYFLKINQKVKKVVKR